MFDVKIYLLEEIMKGGNVARYKFMTRLSENKEKINEYKKRAKDIVAQMTLEEKVFQMIHNSAQIERLNIKAYNWWNEGLHGVARAGTATVFPQAIGLSATFDEELLEKIAQVVAIEARAKFNMQQKYSDYGIYKGLTYWAPNINIFRDPRWGRGHETYGEDPFLTSKLGVSYINGLQGYDENYLQVAACAKHFAVHSGPEDLRHSFDANVSLQDMAETYLPAFKACVIDAKVESVMGAYNRANGEPCCGSKTLLQDILRDTWGFDGHVVSDCWAIRDFHEHHKITKEPVESVALAVNNGCDLNCGSMFGFLIQAVSEGLVEEKTITKSVERLFLTRHKLGMFDDEKDVKFSKISYDKVDCDEHKNLNLLASKKSVVLLKNEDNILPLNYKEYKSIGVIGPNANSRKALVGNYEGTATRYITILEGIQDYLKNTEVRVNYSEGCHLYKTEYGLSESGNRFSEAKAIADMSDILIVCTGLDSSLEGEGGDRGNIFASGDKPNLDLPGAQNELLELLVSSKKPIILVNLTGSAISLNYANDSIKVILQSWYPGAQGGRAVAEIIFGEFSPEGKLPVTFYKTIEELPDFTDYSMKNRTYRYMKNEPLYPFGYGLTYSDYLISKTSISTDKITKDGVTLALSIKNIGAFDIIETLQVYIKYNDIENSHIPNIQLKHIQKVNLSKNQTKKIVIFIPYTSFLLANEEGIFEVKKGEYFIYIDCNQPNIISERLTNKKAIKFNLSCD